MVSRYKDVKVHLANVPLCSISYVSKDTHLTDTDRNLLLRHESYAPEACWQLRFPGSPSWLSRIHKIIKDSI